MSAPDLELARPASPHHALVRGEAEASATGVVWSDKRHEWIAEDELDGLTEVGEGSESNKAEKGVGDVIWLEWEVDDPGNPFHWGRARKWRIATISSTFTFFVAFVASSFAIGQSSLISQLGTSQELSIAALSFYPLGFGLAPLILAPFSEVFGRYYIYIASIALYGLFFVPQALAKNVGTVIVFRFLSGCAGSTGSTLVGGTIADLFTTSERGAPMSMFSLFAFVGTGIGPVWAGFVAEKLDWRWIQWVQLIASAFMAIALTFGTEETRGSVILSRRAARLRKETGLNYQCRSDSERSSLATMLRTSVSRPIYFLGTEAIVASLSAYAFLFWGCLYLALEAVPIVFAQFNYSTAQVGLVFLTIVAGGLLGFLSNLVQERLYRKNFPTRGSEARLYASMPSGILFAVGLFIFAFTPSTGPVGPIVGLVIVFTSIFNLYLAVFSVLADTYTTYASSALAAQSLCRNVAGAVFPLFTTYMYSRLGTEYASMLAALLAISMAVIPFLLFFYGPRIRARSRFAREMARIEGTDKS